MALGSRWPGCHTSHASAMRSPSARRRRALFTLARGILERMLASRSAAAGSSGRLSSDHGGQGWWESACPSAAISRIGPCSSSSGSSASVTSTVASASAGTGTPGRGDAGT